MALTSDTTTEKLEQKLLQILTAESQRVQVKDHHQSELNKPGFTAKRLLTLVLPFFPEGDIGLADIKVALSTLVAHHEQTGVISWLRPPVVSNRLDRKSHLDGWQMRVWAVSTKHPHTNADTKEKTNEVQRDSSSVSAQADAQGAID